MKVISENERWLEKLNLPFKASLIFSSRRYSPILGQIYLLKIASIYILPRPGEGGGEWLFLGIFRKKNF